MTKPNAQPEGVLVELVLTYLKWRDVYAWRNNVGSRGRVRFGFRGSSDVLGITADGRFLAVECKNEHGTVSSQQQAFLDEIRRRGGVACVCRPDSWQASLDEAAGWTVEVER